MFAQSSANVVVDCLFPLAIFACLAGFGLYRLALLRLRDSVLPHCAFATLTYATIALEVVSIILTSCAMVRPPLIFPVPPWGWYLMEAYLVTQAVAVIRAAYRGASIEGKTVEGEIIHPSIARR
jgi:hypothetical protein